MRIEVYKKYLLWRVRIVGRNNETIMNSETYYSHGNAKRAARRLHDLTSWPVK